MLLKELFLKERIICSPVLWRIRTSTAAKKIPVRYKKKVFNGTDAAALKQIAQRATQTPSVEEHA